MDAKEDTISEIRKAHSRYVAAGDALVGYASSLERVQAETLAALDRAREAQDAAQAAAGSKDRWQDLADGAKDESEKTEYEQKAQQATGDADQAAGIISSAKSTVETAVSDRDRAAEHAVDQIEEITSSDDLNDGWWDNWGSKLVAAIADIADMISTIAGILAIIVAFIPVVGTALAGVLIVIAAVAAIVSAVANITLAATGERSWAEAGIAIAGAALSLIGLGAAAKAATGLAKGIGKGALGKSCKFGFGKCFVAGTLIHTPDGPRPIEHIRVGDKVWAHDVVTGRDDLQLVIETFVRTTTELFHLTVNGSVVSTTAEHPFMVHGRGWLDAAFLTVGDLLVTPDGSTVPVEAIETEQRAEVDAEAVYNFHVETHANYYVHVGATTVLVHNAGHTAPDGIPGITFKPKDALGRPTGIKIRLTPEDVAKYGQRTDPPASVRSGLGSEYNGSKHNAGHILGAQLGGPNKNIDNFFIQHTTSNSPWQSAIESEVKKAVVGKIDNVPAGAVDYDLTLKYADDVSTNIPPEVHIKADGNNYNLDITLKNEPDMPNVRETPAFDRNSDGLRFGETGSGPATPRNAPS